MALCTYVMIGALWMLFYIPINALDPEAFHFSRAFIDGNASESLTYFSYVTLTTLGYGDVYPVSPIARSFAILEALTGTLFLAVLISRLVGKYASSQSEESS
jgi:voltage-gated potassium channel Kch